MADAPRKITIKLRPVGAKAAPAAATPAPAAPTPAPAPVPAEAPVEMTPIPETPTAEIVGTGDVLEYVPEQTAAVQFFKVSVRLVRENR